MIVMAPSGERLTVLINGIFGAWLISYDEPASPFFVTPEEFVTYERIEAPEELIDAIEKDKHRTEAAEKRYQAIKPMLLDIRCITDAQYRHERAVLLSKEFKVDKRTIKRNYYRYLATNSLLTPKPRERKRNKLFDDAIQKYYFSAKRHSLYTTYELMLLDNYLDSDGNLSTDIPGFSAFSMYYYRCWKNSSQKMIAREGLGYYKRNGRLLYGSAMAYRLAIGSYQIDETPADIHIVSSFDRHTPIGRPSIYFAVDVATQMITGLYVGMETGERALINCIANAASNKVSFCKSIGIDITPEEWLPEGIPAEIISDRGGEFTGERLNEICIRYSVDININEPFRADAKGIVERTIEAVQSTYASMLAGKGLIGSDAYERWAVDYRNQAVLTLEEFKKIVVLSVLTVNCRVIDDIGHLPSDAPNTPNKLWSWMIARGCCNLLQCDANEVYVRGLPRTTGTYTRRGIYFRQLRYYPLTNAKYTIGCSVTFAYDEEDVSHIYVLEQDKSFTTFRLAESNQRYEGLSRDELAILKTKENVAKKKDDFEKVKHNVNTRKLIQSIIDNATLEKERSDNEV